MESGVRFVACDMPNANDFILHIYAAVAQEERRLISQRTKAALAVAKERGVKLGTHGATTFLPGRNRKRADAFARGMQPIIKDIVARGYTTERAITEELNQRGIPTARGKTRWYQPNVHCLLKRIERLV